MSLRAANVNKTQTGKTFIPDLVKGLKQTLQNYIFLIDISLLK